MASRFWVGGGSANTWAATANTNWSTSSGGANNATVPTTTDVAIFDSHSGSSNSVIGASTTITGLECDGSSLGTGAYAGTLTHNTAVTLTINTGQANSFRLSSSMTYTPASTSSLVTFTHTSGTANIKLYGQKLFAFTVNGAGGTTQPLDAFLCNFGANAILTVTSGIFDLNGGAGGPFACTANVFSGTGSTTRSVILGGTVTIGGAVSDGTTIWNFATTTALTFTKNSAAIVILQLSPSNTQQVLFSGGALTYNGMTLNNSTTQSQFIISGANTFSTLAVGSGWMVSFPANATTTISTAFTWTGTQSAPILIQGQTSNANPATLSVPSGACSLTWGGLCGITGAGGATFTATNVFNFGFNSGWVITPPADETITLTAAQIATGVWQDTTSGDFTVASSIGKSLFTSGNAPGAASGLALVGSAVNASQIGGSTPASTNLSLTALAEGRGTVTTGATTTSVPTSAFTLNGSAASGVVSNQFVNRVILFDGNTTTAGLCGSVSAITASSTSNTPTFTVSPALPATPASGDTFTVV